MALVAQDAVLIRKLVKSQAAIELGEGKDYLIETRLNFLAKREGLDSVHALCQKLRARTNGLELKVVEAMTTNETSFFRDLHPFETLKKVVLPELLKTRRAGELIHVWSSACSSGQEACSIAMTICEEMDTPKRVQILATDLSRDMVGRVEKGAYTQLEVNRGLPSSYLMKYFKKQGLRWHVNENIKGMIEARTLNLIDTWSAVPRMDIVFLRNVLIYMSPENKRRILQKLKSVLKPDGYLFLGSQETTLGIDEAFRTVPKVKSGCYRLAGRGGS